ncbi:MAG: Ig-like domain-containing protein, partial [Candidatus Cloacimonetes bacterium]|nr:Ig-like domain-containing protein [Candidatus Cloacimonadota bacterium]
STYDLNMAYADTVKPAIRTIRSISNHEYEILLNKTVKTFQKISVQSERTKQDLQVFAVNHELDRITVLTSQTDTTKWQFTITELRDSKGNINLKSSMTITGTARQDKTLPAVLSTNPRSGATVNNLQPVLEITFSEIIPVSFFQASMIESDSKKEIPFRLTKSNSTTYRLQPEKPLENYKSCVLTIEDTTSDLSGNKLQQPFKLVFLPIFRTTKS